MFLIFFPIHSSLAHKHKTILLWDILKMAIYLFMIPRTSYLKPIGKNVWCTNLYLGSNLSLFKSFSHEPKVQ